jgi:4-hydroxybenzoate polyprenyltransferase
MPPPDWKQQPLLVVIRALRMNQWTKNGILLVAFLFAYWDRAQQLELASSLIRVTAAIAVFCVISSAVYLVNDIRDAVADRHHPRKRFRPIAAGHLQVSTAYGLAAILFIAGVAVAALISKAFLATVLTYVLLQALYTFALKAVALVDVFIIAAGFVLRAIAGAVAVEAEISPWLLLCAFLLALFLALCKRRQELRILADVSGAQRASLRGYDTELLNQFIAIVSGATIVSYALYTLSAETVAKFHTHRLGFTIPFVMFGIFRYLDLVYRHDKGERPEKILLTDIPTVVNVFLYGVVVIAIFLLQPQQP